jgi:integrase
MAGSRAIKPEEIKRVSKCLTGTRWEHRNRAILFFLAYTACRVSECRNIKIRECFNQDGTVKDLIRIKNTKNGDDRDLFVSENLKKHIEKYLSSRFHDFSIENNGECYLFESERNKGKPFTQLGIQRTVNRFLKEAGLDCTSHGIRKGAISALRRATGISIEQCRVVGGWKDLRTVHIYWKADEQEALDAVNVLKF